MKNKAVAYLLIAGLALSQGAQLCYAGSTDIVSQKETEASEEKETTAQTEASEESGETEKVTESKVSEETETETESKVSEVAETETESKVSEETETETESEVSEETETETESEVSEAAETETESEVSEAAETETESGTSAVTGATENTEEVTEESETEENANKEASYSVSGSTITVSATNGEDIADTLDKALKEAADIATDANPVTVKVPAGSYILSANLHIYSNITLDVTGVTFQSQGKHNMLMSGGKDYNQTAECSGYNGFKNITIKGGVWNSTSDNTATIIRIAHATNVTLDGVTVSGGGCAHQIEVAAINGFYVKGCTFKDYGSAATENTSDKQEALQLDMPCATDVFKEIYEDGTVMKNVEVTGCTFSNVPRGVGTHTMLNGAYHENIKINNNIFKNVAEEAIVGLNYYNCEIKDNTIDNCGAGILFQYFKGDTKSIYTTIFDGKQNYKGEIRHDAKTVITGNTVKTKYSATCDEIQGIKVYGVNLTKASKGADGKNVPAGDYYISGVTVANNTITTAGFGIHAVNLRDSSVTDNKITGADFSAKDANVGKYDGLFITSGSNNVKVENNVVSNMSRNGFFAQERAYVSSLANNTFTNNGSTGIDFYKNSGCSGDITGNMISKAASGGILISTDSTTGNITGNTLTDVGGAAGITLYKNSTAGAISGNTITDVGRDSSGNYCQGIKLTTGCTSGDIANNTITKSNGQYSASNAILVFSESKVNGSVTGNSMADTSDNAMSISTSSTVTGEIAGNTISNSEKSGILIYKSSTVAGGIADNTITSSKKQGINISSTKNNLKITGNKITGGSDNVIIIQPGTTKYTVTVEKNTLSGNKKYSAIRVISGKIFVANNKISKAAYGVYTDKGVKGDVYNNKFGSKVSTQLRIKNVNMKQNTKKANISSVKSSAKKTAAVKWKKVSGMSGYDVEYATDKNFTKKLKKTDAKKKTSVTLKKLKSKKTYYVRLCGYKNIDGVKVHSAYGKVKRVKVK